MLSVAWLVVAVLLAVVLSMWITSTLTRLDRLHARVDAARASLDAQLVRRAAALLHIAEAPRSGAGDEAPRSGAGDVARAAGDQGRRRAAIAQAALDADPLGAREAAENAVGRAILELVGDGTSIATDAAAELREAAARVQVARRFYNDAVRDTRALRARRMPRLLHLAGRAQLPPFFDIDDTRPPIGAGIPPGGKSDVVSKATLRAADPKGTS